MKELMPCPFCGAEAKVVSYAAEAIHVTCTNDRESRYMEAAQEMDAICYAVLDNFPNDSQHARWLIQMKAQYAELHAVLFAVPDEPERDYTPEEARVEAKKRWGDLAYISVTGCGITKTFCEVADKAISAKIIGTGLTFRTAFAAADKAEKENK